MASNLTATSSLNFKANYTNANAISTPSDAPSISQSSPYTNGSGAQNATKLAYGQLTFTAGQTQTINLNSLSDPFGVSFSLVSVGVKGLIFINTTVAAGSWITIKPGATNGWVVTQSGTTYSPFSASAQQFTIGAGGKCDLEAPYDSFAVPDTSHCQIDIFAQLAATLSYVVWG